MAAVHSVHNALTKCTSQQCCQVAEFTALFHECESKENLLAVKQKLRLFWEIIKKHLKNGTQSLNGDFENLAEINAAMKFLNWQLDFPFWSLW